MQKNLRIGLDCDQVLADFWNPYVNIFGNPKNNLVVTKHCQNDLKQNKEFWTNLPVINIPDFTPTLICTKRVNSKRWTKTWLKNKLNIDVPVYQMYYQQGNKANMIKGRVDVFVDDSIENMIQMNLAGVPCLLMNTDHNKSWGPIGRVYNLNKTSIEEAYNLFMKTIFPYFKAYVKIYRND